MLSGISDGKLVVTVLREKPRVNIAELGYLIGLGATTVYTFKF